MEADTDVPLTGMQSGIAGMLNKALALVMEGRRRGQEIKKGDEKDEGRKEKESSADASVTPGIAGM